MEFSIIVPCYNEEKNLNELIEEFNKNVITENYDIEVILVNNGSQDNSKEIMKKLQENNKFIKIETVEMNQGYGYGILRGLKVATGEYLGWVHADLQFNPKELIQGFEYIKENNYLTNIFIKGKRTNRPILDSFFTLGMSLYETLLLHTKLYDINAQPTIFSRELFEKWENPPYDFSLDLYAYYMAKKMKFRVYRYKVFQRERKEGKSSWNTGLKSRIKLIKRVIEYSRKLKSGKNEK